MKYAIDLPELDDAKIEEIGALQARKLWTKGRWFPDEYWETVTKADLQVVEYIVSPHEYSCLLCQRDRLSKVTLDLEPQPFFLVYKYARILVCLECLCAIAVGLRKHGRTVWARRLRTKLIAQMEVLRQSLSTT